MASIPLEGRRPKLSEVLAHEARLALVGCYRRDGRYCGIVKQDLRRSWRELEPVLAELGVLIASDEDEIEDLYQQQVWDEEDGGAPPDPRLADYVGQLRGFVRDTMRLTVGGEPAHWALEMVHRDVCEAPLRDLPVATMHGSEEATLRLKVTPGYAEVVGTFAGEPMGTGWEVSARGNYDFDRWDEFNREARRVLDEQLARLKAAYWDRYRPANRKSHLARLEDDVPRLFRYLFHRRPIADSAERKAAQRLAKDIGIRFPKR
jgi:hypothetical protein